MKVVGFNFTKIHAERTDTVVSTKKITNHIEFTDIQKKAVDVMKEGKIANFNFHYEVTYEPKQASVILNGILLVSLDSEKLKDILKNWKKKQIDEDVRVPLLNVILRKCTLKSFQLEEELNLTPHIPLPRIKKS